MPGIKDIINARERYNNKEQFSTWLSKSLDNVIVDEPQRDQSRGVFYASSLGNPCDRYLYLHYNGLLPSGKFTAKILRGFDHGHSTEYRYRKYFERMRIFLAQEVIARIENPPIHGRADFLVLFPEARRNVIELKTINDAGFRKLKVPQPGHVIQLQVYLNILNIDDGRIIYENKNDHSIKDFGIKKDVELWNKILERCYKIQNMTKVPKLDVSNNHDRYCSCWEYGDVASST